MTRIVAGVAKGRPLAVPSRGTRPTAERVREAVFGSVGHELTGLDGKWVLDLYAGSGALGLEAASRGATRVVLVESDSAAAAVIRRNAERVRQGLSDAVDITVVASKVATFLRGAPTQFDLVFADPPYNLSQEELAATLAQLTSGWLAAGALVVLERSSRAAPPAWPPAIRALRHKRYSDTAIWYGQAG